MLGTHRAGQGRLSLNLLLKGEQKCSLAQGLHPASYPSEDHEIIPGDCDREYK